MYKPEFYLSSPKRIPIVNWENVITQEANDVKILMMMEGCILDSLQVKMLVVDMIY